MIVSIYLVYNSWNRKIDTNTTHIKITFYIIWYFEWFWSIKPAPLPCWGLHNLGKFLEPLHEITGRDAVVSCCGDIVGHFMLITNESRNLLSSNLNFSVLTLSMSLRYFGSELYNQGPNTFIAFSWRDCAGFLFVFYWITLCVTCLGCFLVSILCPIVPSIFGTMCCVIFQTYTQHLWREYNLCSSCLSQ